MINESQLLRLASKCPNIRNIRINRPVVNFTLDGANRLAQLWSRVEKLDLDGSNFKNEVLENLTLNFPELKKLKINITTRAELRLFDRIFLNHPNLVDFECNFGLFRSGAERNWFRSCHLPLQRFAVNQLIGEDATLDRLENCCRGSLRAIKFEFVSEDKIQIIRRIFFNFQKLNSVSLGIQNYLVLQNQPVLPHLEKLCLSPFEGGKTETLIGFLKAYPQMKELHLERWRVEDDLMEKIATSLPNLRSLSFFVSRFTPATLMKLTSLKQLQYFSSGINSRWSVQDIQAFIRQMPSLQRFTMWKLNESSNADFSFLFKSIRDEIRSSGSDRRLWIGRDESRFFPLDSSAACSDEAIEKFVTEINQKSRQNIEHC